MAHKTYLEVVNKVLKKLREPEVTTVAENDYSALIGEFVNDALKDVEDSWEWSALGVAYPVVTSPSTITYTLVGSGTRSRIKSVIDEDNRTPLSLRSIGWLDQVYQSGNVGTGKPYVYAVSGVDSNGDFEVDIYPIPDGAYNLSFNLHRPTPELVLDSDVIPLPYDVIVEGAMARAVSERGLDGGNLDVEARFRTRLGNYIAIEAAAQEDVTQWGAV